jgi:hypothetical protein
MVAQEIFELCDSGRRDLGTMYFATVDCANSIPSISILM